MLRERRVEMSLSRAGFWPDARSRSLQTGGALEAIANFGQTYGSRLLAGLLIAAAVLSGIYAVAAASASTIAASVTREESTRQP